jgi:hypothetical protein
MQILFQRRVHDQAAIFQRDRRAQQYGDFRQTGRIDHLVSIDQRHPRFGHT